MSTSSKITITPTSKKDKQELKELCRFFEKIGTSENKEIITGSTSTLPTSNRKVVGENMNYPCKCCHQEVIYKKPS